MHECANLIHKSEILPDSGNNSELFLRFFAWREGLARLAVDFERVYWEEVDENSKQELLTIRGFIDYLENIKRELCLKSATLSTGAIGFLGPATEVAVAGLVHAINYLSICRARIKETDVALAKRYLAPLDGE